MTRRLEKPVRPRLKLVRSGAAKSAGRRATGPREEKIASARRRMAEGFYDRPDVLERIAEGILRQLTAPSRA